MKIFIALTYYTPHISGLTVYAQRLAKALVIKGHQVKILTMQYDPNLPKNEVIDGVEIIRVPIIARISKGCIAPTIGFHATKLCLWADAVHLHMPQFDAAGIAFRSKMLNKPTILTYHCDLKMPSGLFNQFAGKIVSLINHITCNFADVVVTNTEDYAKNSSFLNKYIKKVKAIFPPIEILQTTSSDVDSFKKSKLSFKEDGDIIIAMVARFASEKGVEVLLKAFPIIEEKYPNAKIVFTGQWENVLGETDYINRCLPKIKELQERGKWHFLGVISDPELASLYKCIDILVAPSLNSTESFGLVQIEAMMNGVPVVASNLPGVRVPVELTGMGAIAEVGDSNDLAAKMIEVLNQRLMFKEQGRELIEKFSPAAIAEEYLKLFEGGYAKGS